MCVLSYRDSLSFSVNDILNEYSKRRYTYREISSLLKKYNIKLRYEI